MPLHFKTFYFEEVELDREKGVIYLRYSFGKVTDNQQEKSPKDETIFEDKVTFEEKITFDPSLIEWEKVNSELLNRTLLNLHLIGGISYYKAACPENIIIKNQTLTKEQAGFWNTLYTRGLGEFFYTNNIDFRGLVNFPFTDEIPKKESHNKNQTAKSINMTSRSLVAIGGGKDSIVTAELLKEQGISFTLFSLNDPDPIRATSEMIGAPRIIMHRTLDPKLFELNEQGAYNGHVPITAYIGFLMMVGAVLFDFDTIIFSLERSANEGQVRFHGMNINHQYSKSQEYEEALTHYIKKYISPDLKLFSLLRPFYEIKIGKLFHQIVQKQPQYLTQATSCNANFTIHKEKSTQLWCGECPKCAFVFAIFAPFFKKEKLVDMFGKNLFDDAKLIPLYKRLLGIEGEKPFECVGTHEEVQLAFLMAAQSDAYRNDMVMEMFTKEVQGTIKNPQELKEKIMRSYESPTMPKEFASYIAPL